MDRGASQAGIDVLRHGGNAVDAAVTTASALGVTIPYVAGPGGGGFMVIYNARARTVTTIDGREDCPASCTRTMFIDPGTHKPMDYVTASSQPLSTGVSSMVATWALAARRFGRRSLGADLRPARASRTCRWPGCSRRRSPPPAVARSVTTRSPRRSRRATRSPRSTVALRPGATTRRRPAPECDETNNIVTTDRWGDVGYTNTINFFGGSGETVPGYGFLLNDEMTDFDFAPSANPRRAHHTLPDPNLPGPRKQPRSSMGPVIALHDGGRSSRSARRAARRSPRRSCRRSSTTPTSG